MGERDEHVVDDVDLRMPAIELGVDVAGRAEQHQRLIDEVDHQVEEQALAALAGALDGPARLRRRPPALVARLEAVDGAERALAQQPLQRQDVGVPAAVLERDGEAAVAGGERLELARLGGGHRERLVDHDVAAGGERRRGDRRVRVVRRRHDDQVQRRRHREQLIGRRHDPRARIAAAAAAWTRAASLVAMAASSRPGVALISGAWKVEPPRP